ncbi:MAG: peptide ligase PGM1-related protein [Actinobacteria bacterium]|nr:peptide ligase PGM1-related protein [Actinomycetota bacterium]
MAADGGGTKTRVITWEERQEAFVRRLAGRGPGDMETGTVVVVPSLSFAESELAKITGAVHYEERLLFMLLFLRRPDVRVVYVTSLPIDPAIIDYYLRLVDDPAGARRRLRLVSLGEGDGRPLSEKLLSRPDKMEELRAAAGDPDDAYLLPFNVTPTERALSELVGLPLYGSPPHLFWLGSKTGSRRTARQAGVAVLEGWEDLYSLEDIEHAIELIRARSPHADAVVIKLNNGFSGQGNAIVELDGVSAPLPTSSTTFCATEETWPAYERKIAAEGAIVEELVRDEPMVSPSVQLRIAPGGEVEVISTHDQVLGGPQDQVYLGCRFPADPDYRLAIQTGAQRVGQVLAAKGVMGSFGIDFLVAHGHGGNAVYLSEINLRMGGTTHPYWMARLATEGTYDPATGELMAGGRPKRYVASDNLKSPALVGCTPAEVIAAVDRAGLTFDPVTGVGATLHLLGALRQHGKMGATCIADTLEEADDICARLLSVLTGPAPSGLVP